jgi:hypothetical protein
MNGRKSEISLYFKGLKLEQGCQKTKCRQRYFFGGMF